MLAATAASALAPAVALATPDDVLLVSRQGLTGPGSNGGSLQPTVSDDGRIVTFTSGGTNLGPPPGQALAKDMATGEVQNLARESGPDGEVRNALHARVSDNGAWACFVGNGFAGTSGGNVMVVREVGGARSTRIAGPATPFFQVIDPAVEGDPYGPHCDVSDDGNRVVYPTRDSYDPADVDGQADVYVYEFSSATHTLVSRADGPTGADANDYAVTPSMTPDGRFVVFRSRADNLSAEDDDGVANVFLRDLATGRTEWISRASGPSGGPGTRQPGGRFVLSGATDSSISDDGRYVAFSTSMSGLDPTVPNPAGASTAGVSQVAVRDRADGSTKVVSRAYLPDGTVVVSNDFSDDPTISSDGRYVAFTSAGSDLDPRISDVNTHTDVFVHDLRSNRTALVSRAPGVLGAVADDFSYYPYMSGDGRSVVFQSNATNLSDVDADEVPPTPPVEAPDVFLRELLPGRPLAADEPGRIAVTPSVSSAPPRTTTELQVLPESQQPDVAAPAAGAAQRGLRRVRGVRVRLSEYGRLVVLIERAAPGRRVGRRCQRPSRRNASRRPCTRYVAVAGRAVAGFEGVNAFSTQQLFGRLRLRPGAYRLTAEAIDFGRLRRTRSRAFRVRR